MHVTTMAADGRNARSEPEGYRAYTLEQTAEGQAGGWDRAGMVPDDTLAVAPRLQRRSHLSFEAKLTLGVLVAALPPSAILLWLAWDTPYL